MRWIIATLLALAFAGAAAAIVMMPSDADHARATPRDMLLKLADPVGQGPLDGLRFDTTMGPEANPGEVQDFVQFDQGLFMSRECTDRCNYPPSAYYARQVEGGTDFRVEAFCPTKDTTMVWRGEIRGNRVSGTVEWVSRRFYGTMTQILVFNGTVSPQPAERLSLE